MASAKRVDAQVPLPQALGRALDSNESLASLGQRLAQSRERFEAIRPWLPEGWAQEVRPGPIDEEGWSLIAPNAAVAAKLRHLLPRLADTLREQGWPELPIRVHIRAR